MVLDESGSSSGDNFSTLIDSFPRKNKRKMIESSPKRKKIARALQIRGNFKGWKIKRPKLGVAWVVRRDP